MKSYADAIRYLDELASEYTFNKNYLGLRRISFLLEQLGNPHRRFASVHVAGTSGKGSTVTLLRSSLQAQGFRVGSTISPHLEDVRERIQINGRKISKVDFFTVLRRVAQANEIVQRKHPRLGRPTYFETLTAAAFLFFAQKKVDIAVVEVGLGGRLDATNVIVPLVSVITSIHKDHTKILGSSLARIAKEKGGIIKARVPVVLGELGSAARPAIEHIARLRRAPIIALGREFRAVERTPRFSRKEHFDWKGLTWKFSNVEVGLLGPHQIHNAALALATLEQLSAKGWRINESGLRRGLRNVKFPGRMEVVGQRPLLILDGAHNPAKMQAALAAVRQRFRFRRLIVVFSAKAQKDIRGMLRLIFAAADAVVLTEIPGSFSSAHRLSPSVSELVKMARKINRRMRLIAEPHPLTAVTRARQLRWKNDLILITGSLFLLAHVRSAVLRNQR